MHSGSGDKRRTKSRRREIIWSGRRGRKRSRLHVGSCNQRKTKRREIIWIG